MKAEITFDVDNWLSITLKAETPAEASQLVRLKMNASAEADKVMDVSAEQNGVSAYITLKVRRDRSCDKRSYLKHYIRKV